MRSCARAAKDDWLIAGRISDWAGKFGPIRAPLACDQLRCVFIYRCGEIPFDQLNDPFSGGADRRQDSVSISGVTS